MKGQKINDQLGEDNYNTNNKGSNQLKNFLKSKQMM